MQRFDTDDDDGNGDGDGNNKNTSFQSMHYNSYVQFKSVSCFADSVYIFNGCIPKRFSNEFQMNFCLQFMSKI